jgi:hypothetical protein
LHDNLLFVTLEPVYACGASEVRDFALRLTSVCHSFSKIAAKPTAPVGIGFATVQNIPPFELSEYFGLALNCTAGLNTGMAADFC